jgi:hypothetical protein
MAHMGPVIGFMYCYTQRLPDEQAMETHPYIDVFYIYTFASNFRILGSAGRRATADFESSGLDLGDKGNSIEEQAAQQSKAPVVGSQGINFAKDNGSFDPLNATLISQGLAMYIKKIRELQGIRRPCISQSTIIYMLYINK